MDYANIKVDYAGIGAEIKSRMDNKGISIKDMAKVLGVSYQAVYGYVKGTRIPTVIHLAAIAQILGSTVDELIVTNYSYI